MALVGRMSDVTRELLKSIPGNFRNLIRQIAEGTNPNVSFHFTEIKVIRGTFPHPPNTDRREVRNSITIQFNGAPRGPIVAHLFNDGTIKSSEQMHQENNQRRAEDERLTAAESNFPALQQTAARRLAERRMMARIEAARINLSWSIIRKQLEKDSAEQEYRLVLQAQAQARAAAV